MLGRENGGGGCCVRSPAPASVRRAVVRRSPALTRWVGGAVPRGGGGGLFSCGQGLVGVLPAQSALVLEFLQSPFLQGGRSRMCVALILYTNQSAVSLGWFWAVARLYPMTGSANTLRLSSGLEDLHTRRSS